MASNSSALIIPSPAPAGPATNDIRGIKPPVEVPSEWAWLWWTLAALVLLGAIIWAWLWWRKRQQATASTAPPVPAHVRAKQRLAEALRCFSDPRQFCFLVSQALRLYLEERFNFRAPERTTEEFLLELQSSDVLLPDQKQSLAEFLQQCDLVKFARFEPTEDALRDLHECALRLVDETQFEPMSATAEMASVPAEGSKPPPLPGALANRNP
jgi:hypothetical protein